MSRISYITGISPMSAVAGGVAEYTGKKLKEKYTIQEVIIENGGDIYADIQENLDIAVFAGESSLSEKVGLHIKADFSSLGICTSSGTVGPSLSFGKADAVMIVCKDTLLADSYATHFANRIKEEKDIQIVLDKIAEIEDILSALIINNDKMGLIGQMELKLFDKK
ncbi:MAG: UPF0280 family protein [Odoribacter sp.]|nr:UPF0280 family protein [Odoribacter sp.]